MGVIYCGNCEGKVSDILDRCPHCCHPMTDQGSADLDRPVRIELTSKSIKLVTGAIKVIAGAAVAVANWHIDGSEKTEIGVVVAVVGVVVFLGARISAWWDTAKNPQNIFRSGGHAIGSLRPCVR